MAHRSEPSEGTWDGWIRSVSTSGLASYTERTSDPRTQGTRRMGRRRLAWDLRFSIRRRRPRPTPRSIGRSTLHEPCRSDGGERTTLARGQGTDREPGGILHAHRSLLPPCWDDPPDLSLRQISSLAEEPCLLASPSSELVT